MGNIRNFQGATSKYKIARNDGSPFVKAPKTNFGPRATKRGGGDGSRPQMNFENKMSIDVKSEPSQGQKSGTGCNDGF